MEELRRQFHPGPNYRGCFICGRYDCWATFHSDPPTPAPPLLRTFCTRPTATRTHTCRKSVKLAAEPEAGRSAPARRQWFQPSVQLGPTSSEMATQTDLVTVNRKTLVVNFLENHECTLEESTIPNCYHYGASPHFIRSPKIPVLIEGVHVPIILDTGAEVLILNTKFVQNPFSW